jgi:hypothetical protein
MIQEITVQNLGLHNPLYVCSNQAQAGLLGTKNKVTGLF